MLARIGWLVASAGMLMAPSALAEPPTDGFVLRRLADVGDVAPGAGGATFSGFEALAVNASGQVGFQSTLSGDSAAEGIFLASDGAIAARVLLGGAAPETGGGSFAAFDAWGLDDSGRIVLRAGVTGGSAGEGIFAASGAHLTALAVAGQSAPGTGGGTYSSFSSLLVEAGGWVAFHATLSGGTASEGIFTLAGDATSALVLAGDTVPGTGGGSYAALALGSLTSSGDVAFAATITGGSVGSGVFVVLGGSVSDVALEGDAAPGTGAGTFSGFGAALLDPTGEVAFQADVAGATEPVLAPPQGGIFHAAGGAVREVIFTPLEISEPGSSPGAIQNPVLRGITSAGGVLFDGSYVQGGFSADWHLQDLDGVRTQLATDGFACCYDEMGGMFFRSSLTPPFEIRYLRSESAQPVPRIRAEEPIPGPGSFVFFGPVLPDASVIGAGGHLAMWAAMEGDPGDATALLLSVRAAPVPMLCLPARGALVALFVSLGFGATRFGSGE